FSSIPNLPALQTARIFLALTSQLDYASDETDNSQVPRNAAVAPLSSHTSQSLVNSNYPSGVVRHERLPLPTQLLSFHHIVRCSLPHVRTIDNITARYRDRREWSHYSRRRRLVEQHRHRLEAAGVDGRG